MDRSVRAHLELLEAHLQSLSGHQMQAKDLNERNRIETEIRAVKTAILHYKAALDIESTLKGSSIPENSKDRPATEDTKGADAEEGNRDKGRYKRSNRI